MHLGVDRERVALQSKVHEARISAVRRSDVDHHLNAGTQPD